jgi:hypothetical protein
MAENRTYFRNLIGEDEQPQVVTDGLDKGDFTAFLKYYS